MGNFSAFMNMFLLEATSPDLTKYTSNIESVSATFVKLKNETVIPPVLSALIISVK